MAQLIYLKYMNIFILPINKVLKLLGYTNTIPKVNTNSLIGVSFYSLIMISYLIDIYRGVCKSQKNILKCALFISYFPILTSGPFIRYENIKNELYGEHKFNYKNMCYGLVRIFWGLFKILAISERLGYFVDTVYLNLETYSGIYTILAVLAFTVQLFTNFSGSIDIIMGISEIISIHLPENFNLPFFSKTITEFWRRWHITLGAWLRDYVFYPLLKSDFMQKLNRRCKDKFGKQIGKRIPLYLSMLILWLLIGVWHGGYKFIISSGILQFVYIFLEETLTPIVKKINNKLNINMESLGYKIYQCVRTYLLFSFSMIFFRATNIGHAILIIKHMFIWNQGPLLSKNLLLNVGMNIRDYIFIIICLVLLLIVGILSKNGDIREKIFSKNIVIRWTIIYALVFGVIIFGCYGPGYDPIAFIYRGF